MKDRIAYLDGHRGVAILLVVGFHAYALWPELLPYGDKYVDIPIFNLGWLGVNLFFLISGFVILMTLEKCKGFKEFIYRRWLRLFPGLLICSLLIYFTAFYFHERPAGQPTFSSFWTGLTFIRPSWWKMTFGFPGTVLEHAHWSLYAEFNFYIFAACVYFWKGQKKLVYSLFAVQILSICVSLCNTHIPNKLFLGAEKVIHTFYLQHFGWFASGSAFYIFSKTKEYKWFCAALGIALLCSAFVRNLSFMPALGACFISLLFALSIINKQLQFLLSQRFLLIIGLISYPLYLIHENMMISMIIKLEASGIRMPSLFYPVLPVIALSLIAYIVAIYGEPNLKKLIKTLKKPWDSNVNINPKDYPQTMDTNYNHY